MAQDPGLWKGGGYYDEKGDWVHVDGRADGDDEGGWFDQQQVRADKPNANNFSYGNDPQLATQLNKQYVAQGTGMMSTGDANAANNQIEGWRGQDTARNDANTLTDRGAYGRSSAQADALGYGQTGRAQNSGARADATGTLTSGNVAAQDARQAAYNYGQAATAAQDRTGPYIDTTDADKYSNLADSARDLQFEARDQSQDARDLQLDDRRTQYGAVGRVRDFYEQGPGPSAAEVQLQQGAERNMAQALALSRSGRGAGVDAAAERQALFQNAATGQELNQQQALLRATEEDAWRGRQLQAMGLEQQGLGNIANQAQGIRAGDEATRAADMQVRAQDLQAQGMSFEQAHAQAQMEADQRQRNDAMTIAMNQLQETASGRGTEAGFNYATLAEQARARGMSAEQYYAELQEQARARGDQTMVSMEQLGVQRQGQGDDYALGMTGIGSSNQLGMYGLGLESQGMGQHALDQELMGSMAYETLVSKNIMDTRIANASNDASRDAANVGAAGSLITGWLSDVSKKKEIKLEDVDYGLEHAKPPESPYANIGRASRSAGDVRAEKPAYQPPPPTEYDFGPKQSQQKGGGGGLLGSLISLSDERSKERIQELTAEVEALRAAKGGDYPTPRQPDYDALDDAYERNSGDAFDLRPARGYSYEYKDPDEPGAAPGRQYGPMAQELLESPAGASTVKRGADGKLAVDTSRLSLVNTAAIAAEQRRRDELEAQVAALAAAQEANEKGIRSPRAVYPGGY